MPVSGKYAQLRYSDIEEENFLTLPVFNYALNEQGNYLVQYLSVGDNAPIRYPGVQSGNFSFSAVGCTPNFLLLKPTDKYLIGNLQYSVPEDIDKLYISPNHISITWLYTRSTTSQFWNANYIYTLQPRGIDEIAAEERLEDEEFCYSSACNLDLKVEDASTNNRLSATLNLVYNKKNYNVSKYPVRVADIGTQDAILELRINGSFDYWQAQIGLPVIFKIYTASFAFWEIKWLVGMEVSNIIVNPQTGEIREMTIIFGYTKKKDNEIGYIKLPTGETLL